MLWNEIYNFYVMYVFGGILTNQGVVTGYFGRFFVNGSNPNGSLSTAEYTISILGQNWTIGNYFSAIATIISIVVIVFICCLLIKKIYNMCAHIIG